MFEIYEGVTSFKQWSKGYRLIMNDLPVGAEVLFYNDPNDDDPLVSEVYEITNRAGKEIRVCNVPNALLTKTNKIKVRIPNKVKGLYGVVHSFIGPNEKYFKVEPSEKPDDYVEETPDTGGGTSDVSKAEVENIVDAAISDLKAELATGVPIEGGGSMYLEIVD